MRGEGSKMFCLSVVLCKFFDFTARIVLFWGGEAVLCSWLRLLEALICLGSFTSCEKDEKKCYFTLSVLPSVQYATEEEQEKFDMYYMTVVELYLKEFGMTSEKNAITMEGNYAEVSKEMKDKFASIVTPVFPIFKDLEFSITIVLSGSELPSGSEGVEELAVKIISNN